MGADSLKYASIPISLLSFLLLYFVEIVAKIKIFNFFQKSVDISIFLLYYNKRLKDTAKNKYLRV